MVGKRFGGCWAQPRPETFTVTTTLWFRFCDQAAPSKGIAHASDNNIQSHIVQNPTPPGNLPHIHTHTQTWTATIKPAKCSGDSKNLLLLALVMVFLSPGSFHLHRCCFPCTYPRHPMPSSAPTDPKPSEARIHPICSDKKLGQGLLVRKHPERSLFIIHQESHKFLRVVCLTFPCPVKEQGTPVCTISFQIPSPAAVFFNLQTRCITSIMTRCRS